MPGQASAAGLRVLDSAWILPPPDDEVGLDPRAGRVYVGNTQDSRIRFLDARTLRQATTVHRARCGQDHLAVDPATGALYASSSDQATYALPGPGVTGRRNVTFSSFRMPSELAVDAACHVVFAIDGLDGDVVVVVVGRSLHRDGLDPGERHQQRSRQRHPDAVPHGRSS